MLPNNQKEFLGISSMANYRIYQDIQIRTNGEIYIGVVGPVRSGKSTFIRRFMELVVLPGVDDQVKREMKDQLPVSGSGKLVTTVEPKFIPKEAVEVSLSEEVTAKVRLIDCVGYMIPQASGDMEDGRERMVKTPWSQEAIPFSRAAEIGTRKVIEDHATIGLVITGDGSFGEIQGDQFEDGLRRTILELKKQSKPFLVIVNSQKPFGEKATSLTQSIQQEYQVAAMSVNCEQLKQEDVEHILEKLLYEFPLTQIQFYIPKWVEMLPLDHPLKGELLEQIQSSMGKVNCIHHLVDQPYPLQGSFIQKVTTDHMDLATGIVAIRVEIKEAYYYQMLSELTKLPISSEYELIHVMQEYAAMKEEYVKVQDALLSVRGCGYGVVTPNLKEITVEEPKVIKQGNKFGVKITSMSPSIHMIKADIETEIAPIVGSQQQAEDLITYIQGSKDRGESIWETNIFGKSIEQLVEDGIRTKIAQISEESQVKLQDTMKKIVNDSKGGLVCIII